MALQELQQTIVNDPLLVIAPVVAILTTILLTYAPNNLGKDTKFWRAVRSLLPYIDEEAREYGFYSTHKVDDKEIVGYWNGPLNTLHNALRSEGFILSPLAAHKSLNGKGEVTSMAHFGTDLTDASKLSRVAWQLTHRHQLHVTVFEASNNEVYDYIITAHYEKSAYSPLTAYQHLKGKGINITRGVVMTENKLKRYGGYERTKATLRDTPPQLS